MGARAPSKRPDRDDRDAGDVDVVDEDGAELSPAAFAALISRVDALEERVESQQQTIQDAIAMVNDLQERVAELEGSQ